MKKLPWGCALALVVFVALVAFGAYAAFEGVRLVEGTVRQRYAVEWTAAFIIQHLKSNENRWPRDWEDLRDEYETMANRSHYAWSFEELPLLVEVRWDVDVTANDVGFADGRYVVVQADNPYADFLEPDVIAANRRITEYLRRLEPAP